MLLPGAHVTPRVVLVSLIEYPAARPALSKYMNDEYFGVHVDNDDEHARMGQELLKDESPRTYARLRKVV